MRSRATRMAHVLERSGLSMVGATCGLLVAVHVGSSISMFTTQGFILIMMILGAAAFYLGIDTPPRPSRGPHAEQAGSDSVDVAELLSAFGTFMAALAAIVSMSAIAGRDELDVTATVLIFLCWLVGIVMQTVAGTITRTRR
jgi:hypothetical protein